MRDVFADFRGGCADGRSGPVEQSPVMVAVVGDRVVALPPRPVTPGEHEWHLYEVDLDADASLTGRVPYRFVRSVP